MTGKDAARAPNCNNDKLSPLCIGVFNYVYMFALIVTYVTRIKRQTCVAWALERLYMPMHVAVGYMQVT